ncbi:2OG-Fe dioxygenase family protein [Massilia sp. Root335]|uniref:2OG-Fe dioxygenase family protein n=1 Tax=Massilia sp. Root335 TaxID=1736517 RepID=UPI0006F4AEFE|nr:2OG-Fe dioxygenase family protein [Massilia sp. Root335]KQV49736.1 hypothetical protein ASC93_12835 [Massilia sp. Root335]
MIVLESAPSAAVDEIVQTGYAVIRTAPLSDEVLDSFNRLPRDEHSLSRHRRIRLSQYFGYCENGQWIYALLPRRRYVQSAEYIRIAEAGGVARHREQLEIDPSELITSVMEQLPVDRAQQYHVNVNQIRVIVDADYKGVTVPEGPHRDGHEFSVVGVARRANVVGGETQVMLPHDHTPLFRHTLAENEAIAIDDERFVHYATNIESRDGAPGYRDIWVIEINRWENRCYGPLHDQRALR